MTMFSGALIVCWIFPGFKMKSVIAMTKTKGGQALILKQRCD